MLRRELFCFYEFYFKFFSKNLKELPFIFFSDFFFELNCFLIIKFKIKKK